MFSPFWTLEFISHALIKFRKTGLHLRALAIFTPTMWRQCKSSHFSWFSHLLLIQFSLLHLKSPSCSCNIVPIYVNQFYRGFRDTVPALESFISFLFSLASSVITTLGRFQQWIYHLVACICIFIEALFFKLKGVGGHQNRKKKGTSCQRLYA